MNERAKITASHLARQAIVYLRQSSTAQVEHNRKSTDRQYALAAKARELGWPDDRITVIDEDLGLSGSGFVARSGFARLTAEVALSHVGLVLGLEVSRLARNNADWHRLIDLGGLSARAYRRCRRHSRPALFNDRLLLGLKGTMSEAELHVLRARLTAAFATKRHEANFAGISGRLCLGRRRWRNPLPSRRSRGHRYPQCLCALCRDRLSTPCLAMVSLGRAHIPSADASGRRDPLGRGQLHRYPPRSYKSRLCRRLCLWQITP